MTTRLAGAATHFLPFDRGWDGGAGNPPDPAGRTYRTAYLWEAVLARDSFLDILARFLHLRCSCPLNGSRAGRPPRRSSVVKA